MKPRAPYPFPRNVTETLLGTANAPTAPSPTPPTTQAPDASALDPNHPFAVPETQPQTTTTAAPADIPIYALRVSGPDGELDNDDDDDGNDDDDGSEKGPAAGATPEGAQEEDDEGQGDFEEDDGEPLVVLRRPAVAVPPIHGWIVGVEAREGERDAGRKVVGCAMGVGGRIVVGVGTQGSVWVWRNDE
jgi:hypothetical protein